MRINNEETIVVKEIGNKEKTEKFTISEIGSADFPFIINTADELINIQNTDYNLLNIDSKTVFYRLGKDIDLSTIENWTPIGTEKNPFVGTLDGDGHTISNLNFNNTSESNFGLFGYSSATLKNIKLENFNITGKDTIGALVGNLKGTIDNIEANNIIINGAENNIGGLVGTCTFYLQSLIVLLTLQYMEQTMLAEFVVMLITIIVIQIYIFQTITLMLNCLVQQMLGVY